MEPSIMLFFMENSEIKISIEAGFEGEWLLIDGYDIGKRVKEYWGDSDYEYNSKISPEGVLKIYRLLDVADGDKEGLLSALAKRFNTNICYSEIQLWLDDNRTKYEGFSWS
jgi:hypothetical protein